MAHNNAIQPTQSQTVVLAFIVGVSLLSVKVVPSALGG